MKRAQGETTHIAKETGVVAGKVGRGLVEGAKGFGSGLKKGYKGDNKGESSGTASEEKKDG